MKQNNFQESEELFEKAIKIDKYNPESFINLSRLLQVQDRNQQALQKCNKALEIQPQNPIYLLHKTYLFNKLNDFKSALQQMTNMVNIYNDIDEEVTIHKTLSIYNLTTEDGKWIQKRFPLLKDSIKLEQDKIFLNQQSKDSVMKNQTQIVQLLSSYRQISQNKTNIQDQKYKKLQQQFNALKKQIQDQKKQQKNNVYARFEELIQKNKDLGIYYCELQKSLIQTIRSYHNIEIGNIQGGEHLIDQEVTKFMTGLKKGLSHVQQVPGLKNVIVFFRGLTESYLELVRKQLIQQINSAFSGMTHEGIHKSLIQMILYMSKDPDFKNKLQQYLNDDENLPWYSHLLKRIGTVFKEAKKKAKQKIVKMGAGIGGWKTSKFVGIARQHCVQILLTIIAKQNVPRLQNANPMLNQAANIWIQNSISTTIREARELIKKQKQEQEQEQEQEQQQQQERQQQERQQQQQQQQKEQQQKQKQAKLFESLQTNANLVSSQHIVHTEMEQAAVTKNPQNPQYAQTPKNNEERCCCSIM